MSDESPLSHCARELRSVEEAHFAVLYGCIYVDDEVGHEENGGLIKLFHSSGMFREIHLLSTWEHMRRLLDKYGEEVLIAAAFMHLPQSLLQTIYAEVKVLLLADGPLSEREEVFLDRLENRINGKWN